MDRSNQILPPYGELKIHSLIHNKIHHDTGKYIFPFHRHRDFLEISLILDGEEIIEYKDASYNAKKGDLIIKNAETLHQETAVDSMPLEEISLGISGIQLPQLPPNTIIEDSICPVIPAEDDCELLKNLFFYILKLYHKGITKYEKQIQIFIQNFIQIVLIIIDDRKMEIEANSRSPLINDVFEYLDANYKEEISLDSVAKTFFVSPYYLARQFKKETGYSVNQYIQNRRLGDAERRLVFEDTPIKEIAADCGYSNLKYFYSVFKTKTGHTPLEFRHICGKIEI